MNMGISMYAILFGGYHLGQAENFTALSVWRVKRKISSKEKMIDR